MQIVLIMKRENRKNWITRTSIFISILTTLFLFCTSRVFAALPVETDQPNSFSDLEIIIANIIRSVVALGGIAVFVMLVAGGLTYLTSGGNPETVQKAKSTLTYAVIGIALFVLAWFALLFLETFTGVRVTRFTLPS